MLNRNRVFQNFREGILKKINVGVKIPIPRWNFYPSIKSYLFMSRNSFLAPEKSTYEMFYFCINEKLMVWFLWAVLRLPRRFKLPVFRSQVDTWIMKKVQLKTGPFVFCCTQYVISVFMYSCGLSLKWRTWLCNWEVLG